MPKLDDAAYGDIADTLRARVALHAPERTDNNESDPGIALLELFAFVTESLLYRQNLLPERGRSSAARLAKFAQALADDEIGLEADRVSVGTKEGAAKNARWPVREVVPLQPFQQ